MDFLTSLDDFPEITLGEAVVPSNGLAGEPPSAEPRTLDAMPPLSQDEVADPIATVEVTAVDEPDAPAPEVTPLPFPDPVVIDEMPEPIALPEQEF